jgi:RNA polymerase sigma-54 factor
MNEKKSLWKQGKEDGTKDEFENEDYDDYDDSESDRVEAEDINIDEYLSSDDT